MEIFVIFKYIKNVLTNLGFFNHIYATQFRLNSYWTVFQFHLSSSKNARMQENLEVYIDEL